MDIWEEDIGLNSEDLMFAQMSPKRLERYIEKNIKMASPQIEDGYTKIANEIVEQLAKIQLSGYESRYLWVLWRKTYGWGKAEDTISNSQFTEATGLSRQHIWHTEQRLLKRKIVAKNGYKLSFNKNYEEWLSVADFRNIVAKNGNTAKKQVNKGSSVVAKNGNKKSVAENGTVVAKIRTSVAKNGAYKRNLTKETYTKETIPYVGIINYLNLKTNSHYKPTTPLTKRLIQLRWKEEFRLEDFQKVIDNKTADWLYDGKMEKFLRPETLFGTKFEGYLQEKISGKTISETTRQNLRTLKEFNEDET